MKGHTRSFGFPSTVTDRGRSPVPYPMQRPPRRRGVLAHVVALVAVGVALHSCGSHVLMASVSLADGSASHVKLGPLHAFGSKLDALWIKLANLKDRMLGRLSTETLSLRRQLLDAKTEARRALIAARRDGQEAILAARRAARAAEGDLTGEAQVILEQAKVEAREKLALAEMTWRKEIEDVKAEIIREALGKSAK